MGRLATTHEGVRHVDESPFVADVREREQLQSAYGATANAKHLFLGFQAAGVDFQERLQVKPWGVHEFVVRDPDRDPFLFGTPSASAWCLTSRCPRNLSVPHVGMPAK